MEQKVFDADGRSKEKEEQIKKMPLNRRVSLRRYMSKVPAEHANSRHESREGSEIRKMRRRVLDEYGGKERDASELLMEKIEAIIQRVRSESNDINWVRSSSLGLWASCVMTPGFIGLFRALDHFLGTIKTPFTIGCRLVCCFLWSLPNNAAFFAYGTCVHHTLEWWEGNQTQVLCVKSSKADTIPDPAAFNFDEMITKVKMKIEAEIETTVKNSAKLWIPVNFVNFTVVPPHMRQLTMNGTSVFWNCYISLVQHRDIITQEEDAVICIDQ